MKTFTKYSIKYLCQRTRKVVTIIVHKMVAISPKLISQFFNNATYFLICKIGTANLYALSELELFAEFVVVTWGNLEDASKRERVATIRKFRAKCFYAGVKDAKTN